MAIRRSALAALVIPGFWSNKRVFLTGHTGFKGGWLALWLAWQGAEVHGFALPPATDPSFFVTADVESYITTNTLADIRDDKKLLDAMRLAKPDIVFHLAAQPLVRYSYDNPVETYTVNVIGTLNVLEAVRQLNSIKAVVNVTTDKCYENREWVWPYRESEALGGYDPYSSSKACSELVSSAYYRSFFQQAGQYLATARAGNVIGGGDWALDRLIPDFLRALDDNAALTIRSPNAVRPWQHVLEPLSGYLLLAESLYREGDVFAEPWNFGPEAADTKTVRWIAEYLCDALPGMSWQGNVSSHSAKHEANSLQLDNSKAKAQLGWLPRWNLETALGQTLAWHQAWQRGENMAEVSLAQIERYADETVVAL